ncbi:MAG: hypothetical protein KDB05_32855 [Planctomycetales bacterium]|nr:hypothetical protein [Planctomycetales bacterium]
MNGLQSYLIDAASVSLGGPAHVPIRVDSGPSIVRLEGIRHWQGVEPFFTTQFTE